MFVLPGVLGVATSLVPFILRGIPPDKSGLMGASPRINLDCEKQKSHEVISYTCVGLILKILNFNMISREDCLTNVDVKGSKL